MSSIPRISRSFLVHFSSQSDFINAAKPSWTHKYVSLRAERAVVSAKPSGETTVGTWAGAPASRARPGGGTRLWQTVESCASCGTLPVHFAGRKSCGGTFDDFCHSAVFLLCGILLAKKWFI